MSFTRGSLNDVWHNKSGAYDRTAGRALTNTSKPKPGEIYNSTRGNQLLVVGSYEDGVCLTLKLNDIKKSGSVEVHSKNIMYTKPYMLSYTFDDIGGDYVKTMPESEFKAILKAIAAALGVDTEQRAVTEPEDKSGEIERLNKENAYLQQELAKAKSIGSNELTYKMLYDDLIEKLVKG